MFSVFPVFLAAAGDHLSINEERLGYLPSMFYIGYTLIAMSTVFWIRRVHWQWAAAIGVATTVLALVAMWNIDSYTLMLLWMVDRKSVV